MVGAGIVGIPYAFYHLGITASILMTIIMTLQTYSSCYLYLKTKNIVGGLESIQEIGFLLMGRSSVFIVSSLVLINAVGSLIAYFNIFGGILASVYTDFISREEGILSKPEIYIVILSLLILPPMLKKSVEELEIIAQILFATVILLEFTIIYSLITVGTSLNPDTELSQYFDIKLNRGTITGITIFVWAYSF